MAELAELVKTSAGSLGIEVNVESFPNPRVEMEEHYYNPVHSKLLDLGLKPNLLGEELVHTMLSIIATHKDRVIERAIVPTVQWNPGELQGDKLGAN